MCFHCTVFCFQQIAQSRHFDSLADHDLLSTPQITSCLGFVGFPAGLCCEMIGAVLFERTPLLLELSCCWQVNVFTVQIGCGKLFPGETKVPRCFQLCLEISEYWREEKKVQICSLTGLANVPGFSEAIAVSICLDLFYLMPTSDILVIYGCICFVWLSKETAIWYCQCYWSALPKRKGDFAFHLPFGIAH